MSVNCNDCRQNVEEERKFNWIAFLLLTVFYLPFYLLKKKNCPICKGTNLSTTDGKLGSVGDYENQEVSRVVVMVMETLYIIGTSKALDTIQGRYEFLMMDRVAADGSSYLGVFPSLIRYRERPNYELLAQRGIDQFKAVHYNSIPTDYQLSAVLSPASFNVSNFYCTSLALSFFGLLQDQIEAIKILKKEDAKKRRIEKIRETLRLTIDEVVKHCASASSYEYILEELNQIGADLDVDTVNSNESPTLTEGPKEVRNSIVTSISRKARQSTNQEIVLDAKSRLPLTLVNADKALSQKIRQILDDEGTWNGEKRDLITPLFAEFNLEVKEVEDYRKKYGPIYKQTLEDLQNASSEWQTANAVDREDLMADFRPIALRALHERADCDLVTLFECEPADVTADDALIKEYGFEAFETYLRFADKLDKVRVIPNDNYNREKFVKLTELGLALRGSAIPIKDILEGLTLKVLNEIADNPAKEFKRKNLAVAFILSQDGYEERIAEKVGLLELFKLQPLPEPFSNVDIKAIASSWRYTYTVVELFVRTYVSANDVKQMANSDSWSFRIKNHSQEVDMCPRAKEYQGKVISKIEESPVPCHVGCNCQVRLNFV